MPLGDVKKRQAKYLWSTAALHNALLPVVLPDNDRGVGPSDGPGTPPTPTPRAEYAPFSSWCQNSILTLK